MTTTPTAPSATAPVLAAAARTQPAGPGAGTSLLDEYLEANCDTRSYLNATLLGRTASGDDLVSRHLAPMIDAVYARIRSLVDPDNLTQAQARMYIAELGVFARYNAQFLKLAANTVDGFCPELAHELRRNYLEEGGERGKVPAHYILYSNALLSDLDLRINGHVPAQETATLVLLHQVLVNSHMPSVIAGGYYATEGVAIAETEILRDITNRYGELTIQASGAELPALDYYYRLHLDDDHDAAQVEGLSVEAAHIEGLAQFIRNSDLYGFDLPQALEGFLQIFNGMTDWWTRLANRARELN